MQIIIEAKALNYGTSNALSRQTIRQGDNLMRQTNIWIAAVAIVFSGLTAISASANPTTFASAAQVESSFRGHTFILGNDDQIADVRALDWTPSQSIKLPFWFGSAQLVPSENRPEKGNYYVISEAWIVRQLTEKELLIRAGSKLQKPDAVLVTKKTHYKSNGAILPTIVQYTGTRTFTRQDGSKVDIAVLEEVSLPAQYNGRIPLKYARFAVGPSENLHWTW
jgi:hypothetical protein